jgi:hypothetical protein
MANETELLEKCFHEKQRIYGNTVDVEGCVRIFDVDGQKEAEIEVDGLRKRIPIEPDVACVPIGGYGPGTIRACFQNVNVSMSTIEFEIKIDICAIGRLGSLCWDLTQWWHFEGEPKS